MEREEILGLLKGKEESVVFVTSYETASKNIHGIYVGTKTVESDKASPDAIVLMYRDWRERRCVDTVLLQDITLDVSDCEGQLRVRYTKPDSSTHLTERHENYKALQKLVDTFGL